VSFVLEKPITYLITRGEATSENFNSARRQILDIIGLAVEECVSMIQIREKQLSAKLLCELTESAVAITRGRPTKVLVNDRADIALACGADGVHLTADSIPSKVIRGVTPKGFLIGSSAHSLEDVNSSIVNGADFVVLAPVYGTPGKGEPLGLERFAMIIKSTAPFPILALGGVDRANYNDVLSAGASGFAAIRAMNDPEKLRELVRNVRSQ